MNEHNAGNTQQFFANTTLENQRVRISLIFCALFLTTVLTFPGLHRKVSAADGDLDPTFGNGGMQMIQIGEQQRDFAKTVAVLPNGKIIIGGEIGDFSSDGNHAVLIRLNADGTLDPTFGIGGKIVNPGQRHLPSLVIQPDGKIVTAGATTTVSINLNFVVARYNADGTLDQTFGNGGYAVNGDGTAESVFLQPDGKIVLVGFVKVFREGSDWVVARFNADGTPDQTFGTGGRVQTSYTSGLNSGDNAHAGALQTDGKIVVTGTVTGISAVLARYNSNGSVDTSFGLDGSVLTPNFGATTRTILIQPDGKIVVGGGAFVLGRYNANGTTDHSFGNDGRISGGFGSGNGFLHGITIQPDGKLFAGGSVSYTGTGDSVFALSRYNPNGTLDQAFGNNGFVLTNLTDGTLDEANALTLQPDGKIILAGYAAEEGGANVDFAAARYLNTAATAVPRAAQFDFDGDLKADVSVFRQGTWYVNRSTAGFMGFQFGLSGDAITPADFDGDGKTDIAVFRPSDGNWYVYNSGNNTYSIAHFGANGDIPTPADYDNDGKADYAVFRGGVWYIQRSTAGLLITQFGVAADKPVAADYDGDGKTDIAVYRDGTWYLQKSAGGNTTLQFGLASDMPVACDYDGDGKADIAVWRPTDSVWHYLKSSDGSYYSYQFGLSGDMPAPADYNGDGKADIAINRGGGEWWIWQSGTNYYLSQNFGSSGDMPVPSAYIR
jgi:uncharacterized delta-60 repeat protein